MKKKSKAKADVAIRIYKEDRKKLKIIAIHYGTTIAGAISHLVRNY